jgi:predicted alpha/beta hydrolase
MMLETTTAAPDSTLVAIRAFDLHADDQVRLGATLFEPARPHGVVIIHGATAVPQRYYQRFATFAAQATGARVITYDYRGVGRSRPVAPASSLRGFDASLHDWAALDAPAVHEHARRHFAGERAGASRPTT